MEFIFIINLLLFGGLSFYRPYYLSRFFGFGFLNPIVLTFLVSLPVLLFKTYLGPALLLDGSLFNKYYQFALFQTNLALGIQLVLTVAVLKYLDQSESFARRMRGIPYFTFTDGRLAAAGGIFLLLFLLCFVLLANHSYGLLNWLMHPREGYQLHRVGAGHYYALCVTFLSVSFVLVTLSRKRDLAVFLCTGFYLVMVYFLGSKGFILSFAVYFLIVMWLRKCRYLWTIIGAVVPVAFLLMVVNLFKGSGLSTLRDIFEYFDYYVNSANYYEAYFNNEIDLFFGKIFVTEFWGLVPRAFYPDKPYVYGFLHVNEFFFPGAAEATNTPAFEGPIQLFADFGTPGVLFFSFLNLRTVAEALMTYVVCKNLRLETLKHNSKQLYLYVFMFAPSFLFFFNFPLNLVLFAIIVAVLSVTGRVTVRSGSLAGHPGGFLRSPRGELHF